MTCQYQLSEPNLLAFEGDRALSPDEAAEFRPGTSLTFRCKDIGKYALIGSGIRTCEYGDWTGVKTSCIGLSQEHDYARKFLYPEGMLSDRNLVVGIRLQDSET